MTFAHFYKSKKMLNFDSQSESEESENVHELTLEILQEVVQEVSQSKKKTKDSIKILVGSVSWDGLWTFYVTPETKISRLKMLVLFELYGSEFDGFVSNHMLSFPSRKRSLRETRTVKDECIHHEDVLDLVKLNPVEETFVKVHFDNFDHHISDFAIVKCTAHLPKPKEKQKLSNVVLDIQGPDFMCDVRKIMISLIEYSFAMMYVKPNAKYIFDVVRRKLMCENFVINEEMVNKYQSSGANARRIKFAISSSYNDTFSVNQWLAETASIDSEHLGVPRNFIVEESTPMETELKNILALFRQYLRASFRISTQSLEHLIEMGFSEMPAKEALRYTGNSVQESVIYLLGYRDLENDGAKPGLDVGMSVTSDMYKEIMKEDEIIIPLSKPNVLYACLSIMDANAFLVSSIRFPSVMNLLNKILSTYYVNKCDMAMKQMLGQIPND